MKRRTMNDDDDAFWIVSLCDLHRFPCLRERVYVRLCVCFRSAFARGSVRLLSLSFASRAPLLLLSIRFRLPKRCSSTGEREREGRRERRFLQTICFVSREKKTQAKETRERRGRKEIPRTCTMKGHRLSSSLSLSRCVSLPIQRLPFISCILMQLLLLLCTSSPAAEVRNEGKRNR